MHCHLLPLKNNQVINLRTLQVTSSQGEFDSNSDLEFNQFSDFSNVESYFRNMFDDDEEIQYLQMLLGYCITGELETDMKNIILFIGDGKGKTTICILLSKILDNLCQRLPSRYFTSKILYKNFGIHMSEIVDKRLCFSELDDINKLNIGLLKGLVSKENFIARKLYQNPMLVILSSKYIFESNTMLNCTDCGFLRRIQIIPFTKKLSHNNTNMNLNELFSWICIGANNYYRNKNFKIPESFTNYIYSNTNIKTNTVTI